MTSRARTTDGRIDDADGGAVVRFERRMSHPPEAVWAALTEPDRLADWLGRAALDAVEGGSFQLRWDETGAVMHGTVTGLEEPSLFAYSGDPHGEVRFELSAEDGGTRLVLSNALPSVSSPEGSLASWHMHLDLLARALDGDPAPWDRERWAELRDRYAAAVG